MHLLSRVLRRTTVAALITAVAWPFVAVPAFTQTAGALSVSPASIVAGSGITLSASGFKPGETVAITSGALLNVAPPTTTTADGSGNLNLAVPTSPLSGSASYAEVATGASSGHVASGTLNVTAVSMSIALNPSSVQAGASVTITAGGFDPGEAVGVQGPFAGGGTNPTASASGQVSITRTVSALATPDSYAVTVRGSSTSRIAAGSLNVTAYSASVSAANPNLPAGQSTSVIATGFLPGEQVTISLPGGFRNTVTADGSGTATTTASADCFFAPASGYTLSASGQTSGRTARGSMAIAAFAGSVTLSPSSVTAGDAVTLNVSGFPAAATLYLNGPPTIGGVLTTDANGSYSGTFSTSPGTPAASYSVNVQNGTGCGAAEALLTIADANPAPAFVVSATSVRAGDAFQVSGGGYQPGEQVQIDRMGPTVTTTADANRDFSATVAIGGPGPNIPNGAVDGAATGLLSNYQTQGFVNVTARPTTMIVTPSTVASGGSVTVQLTNETPGSTPNFFGFDGIGSAPMNVDANGSAQLTVTVPASAASGVFLASAGGGPNGSWPASTAVTVNGFTPSLSFNPSTVTAGGSTTVSGAGFVPGESVNVAFGGFFVQTSTSGSLNLTADANGSFSAVVNPKVTIPNGARLITANGSLSRQTVGAALNVIGYTPSLSVSPNPATAGGMVTVTGIGFPVLPLAVGGVVTGGSGTVTVSPQADGSFSAVITVQSLLPGTYSVSARNAGTIGSPSVFPLAATPLTVQAASTPTPTVTDTATATPTSTSTLTPTVTPTLTPTNTPTPTPTNTATPTATPTPTPAQRIAAISTLVNSDLASGAIDNAGIANSLQAKLSAASSSLASGDRATARNQLNALINEVQAQSGKHVTTTAANALIAAAQAAIAAM